MSRQPELGEFIQPVQEFPFYNPNLSYYENYELGPFGGLREGKRYQEIDPPSYKLLGEDVNLPFGIAAGPLINGRFVKAALDRGFDVVTYKTVRSRYHAPHLPPHILAVHPSENITPSKGEEGLVANNEFKGDFSIVNSLGVPSADPKVWQPDVAESLAHADPGQMVIVSFQGTLGGNKIDYLNDFVKTAALVKEAGARVVEMNLSCPNEGTDELLCYDSESATIFAHRVKAELGSDVKLLVKLGYFEDKEELRRLMGFIGYIVDGVSVVNTIPAKIYKDYTKTEPALRPPSRLISGVGGPAIKWAGIEMVKSLSQIREELNQDFAIFGTGGVKSKDDWFEYTNAGADCVMSATGAIFNYHLAQDIKEYLQSSS